MSKKELAYICAGKRCKATKWHEKCFLIIKIVYSKIKSIF